MKNLFVGSEGTLGVVTRVAMQAFPVGKDIQTALVANLRTYEERQRLFEFVLDHVPSLRAFEFFEDKVLFETSGSLSDAVLDELSATYPGTSFAQSDAQRKSFWHLREDMPLKVARVARERKLPLNKFDVSVPIQSYDALVQKVVALLSTIPNCELFVYGHYADGNLHINIIGQMEVEHLQEIYDAVVDCNGSISAEHGIGVMKKSAFHRAKPRELIQAMKAIKSALDPHHILNPGKIL
jgi:FAD/FMN-containing dehydrogenase